MKIIDKIDLLRAELSLIRSNKSVALVPTMGNLHSGHLALVAEAKKHADIVVISVFVNPMQFDRQDDFIRYPRTLQQDCEQLAEAGGVDFVFAPTIEEMYPEAIVYSETPVSSKTLVSSKIEGSTSFDFTTFVEVPVLSYQLEGKNRPGHFRGVTTVVTKLFNIVQPHIACFGEKDFQQIAIIRKMVKDLNIPVEIFGVVTLRAEDGLALSSRNHLLNSIEREKAPILSQVMFEIAKRMEDGDLLTDRLIQEANIKLEQAGFIPDELFICDADNLQPLTISSKRAVILMAATLGKARLIDNTTVTLPSGL